MKQNLQQKDKTLVEKDFYKLMNNSNFRTLMMLVLFYY